MIHQLLSGVRGRHTIEDVDAAAVLTEEEIRSTLRELKERLRSALGTALVHLKLFGSRARGDADPDSDVDVAVIVHGCDSNTRDLVLDVASSVELEHLVPLSIHIFCEDEYARLLERERRIALDIDREGVPL